MKKNTQKVSKSNNEFDSLSKQEFDFISSKSKAILLKSPAGARNLMIIIGLFLYPCLYGQALLRLKK